MSALFKKLYEYQAWANADLFEKMRGMNREKDEKELQVAISLLSHSYIVAKIFCAHLSGSPHNYRSDNTSETPSLGDLRASVAACDQWYIDYAEGATPESLAESIRFSFTDGDQGSMTREEMLTHVALHGGYHRGEVGRILWQLSITPPWDIFSGYLHQREPERRQ